MALTWRDGSVAGTCSVCGEPAWSIRSNKCETHKVVHQLKAKAPKGSKGKPTRTVNSDGSAAPVVTQFVETAGAINAKTFSGKAPTASEWEEKLTALVVLGTMTYVEYVVLRPFQLPEPQATEAIAMLGMTSEEATTIVEPLSYVLSKSKLNKDHGREAIEILAFAPAILAIVAWVDRLQTFRSQMLALQQGQPGGNSVSSQSDGPTQGASTTPGGAPIANFAGVTDPNEAPTARVDRASSHLV